LTLGYNKRRECLKFDPFDLPTNRAINLCCLVGGASQKLQNFQAVAAVASRSKQGFSVIATPRRTSQNYTLLAVSSQHWVVGSIVYSHQKSEELVAQIQAIEGRRLR
jgi:hypothetical protein